MIFLISAMTASASTPDLTLSVDGSTVSIPSDMVEMGLFIHDLDTADQQLIAQSFQAAVDDLNDAGSSLSPNKAHSIYQDLADNLCDDLGEAVCGDFLDLDAMDIVQAAAETTSASDWQAEWTTPSVSVLLPSYVGEQGEPEPEYSIFTKSMALGVGLIGGALGMATGNPVIAGAGAAAGVALGEAIGDAVENYAEQQNKKND